MGNITDKYQPSGNWTKEKFIKKYKKKDINDIQFTKKMDVYAKKLKNI